MKRELLGLAVGMVGGAAVTWLGLVPFLSEYVQLAPSKVSSPIIAPCESRLEPIQADVLLLRAEMTELKGEWDEVQANETQRFGKPIAWSDDVSDVYRRLGMEVLIAAAIKKGSSKLEVLEWSCDEFPCIVALEGRSLRYYDSFMNALTARGFERIEFLRRTVRRPRGTRHYIWLLSYWDEESNSDALRKRISVRMDRLMESLLHPEESLDGG